jgi:hypothetical protein
VTDWEERMSARAAERRAAEPPPLTPFTDPDSEHFGHHSHLRGAMVECSCGLQHGITSVAINFDDPQCPWCSICGEVGVCALGVEP